ncbi:hypothetical protein RRG08_003847 [Elysia crispata]|uniref:Uncharacterized protein n=1 Tax=Elysia crispata TaxID=231223 RepID=A0AAE0ZES6_9GAST|nr:hypothetical protein RRG08_003847 [Elysia crispata]
MHDPKMSTMTAHAQQDLRSHAPLVGSGGLSDNLATFGCSPSVAPYRHHPLLQPVPISLHPYLPMHHHHHHYFFQGKTGILGERSDRVPPLSPPVADTVPSTLPIPSTVSSFALASSTLDTRSDLPFHRVYDSSSTGNIGGSLFLQQHYNRLPAHLRARDEERHLALPPNVLPMEGSDDTSRWAHLYDLELAAAHYYQRIGASDHRLVPPSHMGLFQKDGPGYGVLSPILARAYPLGREYLRLPDRALVSEMLPSAAKSLPHPDRSPCGVSDLPVSKTSPSQLSSSTLKLSIPSSISPPSLSSSSSSPTSPLSKRAGALTLSCTPCSSGTTSSQVSLPSPYPSTLSKSYPMVTSPPISPKSQPKQLNSWTSRSPELLRRSPQSQSTNHSRHNHPNNDDKQMGPTYHPDQHRPSLGLTPSDVHVSTISAGGSTRKHFSDLDPFCNSPKRPALISSLSMPAAAPRIEEKRPSSSNCSPMLSEDRALQGFTGCKENSSPINFKMERTQDDKEFQSVHALPTDPLLMSSRNISLPRSSVSPQELSPMESLQRSLHGHLLMSTQVKTERCEPWPLSGSIVTGIPPARYTNRYSMFRYGKRKHDYNFFLN